jgi:hypothetical protein
MLSKLGGGHVLADPQTAGPGRQAEHISEDSQDGSTKARQLLGSLQSGPPIHKQVLTDAGGDVRADMQEQGTTAQPVAPLPLT